MFIDGARGVIQHRWTIPHQEANWVRGQHQMESQAVGWSSKYLDGNAEMRRVKEKCFLFAVYLSVWEQVCILRLMSPYPTVLESISAMLGREAQGWPHKEWSCFVTSAPSCLENLDKEFGGREGKERRTGPSHLLCPSWDLMEEENTGSDILDLQALNVFWLFKRRTKGSGFRGMIVFRTFDSRLKASQFLSCGMHSKCS